MRHPIQPLSEVDGVVRFKRNAIVCWLLDNGPFDMNTLASLDFSREDREQFAQLIGYSLSGFSELGYVRDETFRAASTMHDLAQDEKDARIDTLEATLEAVRNALREAAVAVFQIHPDDLHA